MKSIVWNIILIYWRNNMGDFGVRKYESFSGRFTSIDPLWEKYYSWSLYVYSLNNPIVFIDPDGLNPIFDKEGSFIGTDDCGLQGEAIIMDKVNFKQGMSNKAADIHNLGLTGLLNQDAIDRFNTNFQELEFRPDWDGYLTFEEAKDWYQKGNGQPLFVDLEKIDLSGIFSLGEGYVGQHKTFNLLIYSNNVDGGLIYGQITLKRYPDHMVRAYSDKFDFEMHSWWNPFNWDGNIETALGQLIVGDGKGFEINIYGSKKLTPIILWGK